MNKYVFLLVILILVFSIIFYFAIQKETFDNNSGIEYDFIEIGTSNFDTEIEKADDNTVGLSYEPLKTYLDDLPEKLKCKKINKAVSNKNDKLTIFYIKPENIKKYNLPDGLKGCNSLNKPHPIQIKHLNEINRIDLIDEELVDVITFEDLVKEHNVNKIKLLKIDTEGHEPFILDSMIDYCDKHDHIFPKKIIFETNANTPVKEQNQIISKLEERKYKVIERGHDTIVERINV